jgi:uncharacterized protein YecT (DUF1311 family)
MRFITLGVLASSILITSSAISQTEPTTLDIAQKSFEQADTLLNQTYQNLQKKITSLPLEKKKTLSELKEVQRTWILFRDMESVLRASVSSQGGSAYTLDLIANKTELTNQRIKELKFLTNSLSSNIATPPQLIKKSTTQFDISKEVVNFVSNLIEKDSKVKSEYKSLIAPFEESAGGRFKVGELTPIELQVPKNETVENDTEASENQEYIYLVQQQLISGYRHGYSATDNIFARVHVFFDNDKKHQPPTLKLLFDGFVDVTIQQH